MKESYLLFTVNPNKPGSNDMVYEMRGEFATAIGALDELNRSLEDAYNDKPNSIANSMYALVRKVVGNLVVEERCYLLYPLVYNMKEAA